MALRINGPDTVVDIGTCYGLDGSGIECRWGQDFPEPSRQVLGPSQPSVKRVLRLFTGGEATGAWR